MSHQSPKSGSVMLSPSPIRSPAHKKHRPNVKVQPIAHVPSDQVVTVVSNVSASEQDQISRIVKIVQRANNSSSETVTFTKQEIQALIKNGAIFGDSNVEVESTLRRKILGSGRASRCQVVFGTIP